MRLARAKIQNPTSEDTRRLQHLRVAQALPSSTTVVYTFSWALVLVAAGGVIVLPLVCWARGDLAGVIIFTVPAASAILELAKLALRKGVPLPTELFWSVIVGVPILSLLFFWISCEEPVPSRCRPSDTEL